jgi:hypothetical protein
VRDAGVAVFGADLRVAGRSEASGCSRSIPDQVIVAHLLPWCSIVARPAVAALARVREGPAGLVKPALRGGRDVARIIVAKTFASAKTF